MKIRHLLAPLGLALASVTAHADNCGTPPASPAIPDGKQANLEQLVEASKAVKQYIAEADQFLDCRDAVIASPEFAEQSDADKQSILAENKQVLDTRNNIGDSFNQQVQAYKKANPQ